MESKESVNQNNNQINFLDNYKCYHCNKVFKSSFQVKEHISYYHKLLFNPDIILIKKNININKNEVEKLYQKIEALENRISELEKK